MNSYKRSLVGWPSTKKNFVAGTLSEIDRVWVWTSLEVLHWKTACLYSISIHNWYLASKHWKLRWDCMHISSDLSLFTSVKNLFSASSIFSKYDPIGPQIARKPDFVHANNKGADHPTHPAALLFTLWNVNSMHNFNMLTTLCSWAGWFGQYKVRNPEDRFSRVEAQLFSVIHVYKSFRLVWTLFDRAYIVTD